MNLVELRQHRTAILATAERYGARNIRVFGSVARGTAGPRSDVDFLVEFEPGRGLFARGALWDSLQELLGCDIDLLTERSLRPTLREPVLREAIPL
jgi:predicted nucleotidyltransferase